MMWAHAAYIGIDVGLVAATIGNAATTGRLAGTVERRQLLAVAVPVAFVLFALCAAGWAAVEQIGRHRPDLLVGVAVAAVGLAAIRACFQNHRGAQASLSPSESRLPQLLRALCDLKLYPILAGGAAAAIGVPFWLVLALMAIPTAVAGILGLVAGHNVGLQLSKRGGLIALLAWVAAFACCIAALALD